MWTDNLNRWAHCRKTSTREPPPPCYESQHALWSVDQANCSAPCRLPRRGGVRPKVGAHPLPLAAASVHSVARWEDQDGCDVCARALSLTVQLLAFWQGCAGMGLPRSPVRASAVRLERRDVRMSGARGARPRSALARLAGSAMLSRASTECACTLCIDSNTGCCGDELDDEHGSHTSSR
jgi:hypothetical protein